MLIYHKWDLHTLYGFQIAHCWEEQESESGTKTVVLFAFVYTDICVEVASSVWFVVFFSPFSSSLFAVQLSVRYMSLSLVDLVLLSVFALFFFLLCFAFCWFVPVLFLLSTPTYIYIYMLDVVCSRYTSSYIRCCSPLFQSAPYTGLPACAQPHNLDVDWIFMGFSSILNGSCVALFWAIGGGPHETCRWRKRLCNVDVDGIGILDMSLAKWDDFVFSSTWTDIYIYVHVSRESPTSYTNTKKNREEWWNENWNATRISKWLYCMYVMVDYTVQ